MASTSYEARVILALKAIQNSNNLSIQAAATLYNVQPTTLYYRQAGRPAQCDIPPNSRKLTDLEEDTIVRYIIELCMRSFPSRLCGMEDMANQLLYVRDVLDVG